jgi:hypothetical protein
MALRKGFLIPNNFLVFGFVSVVFDCMVRSPVLWLKRKPPKVISGDRVFQTVTIETAH